MSQAENWFEEEKTMMKMTKKDMLKVELLLRLPALIILVLLCLTRAACGQSWVEERTYVSGGTATPRIDGLFTKQVKGAVGSFVWFQVQQAYSQTYAGVTYSPKPFVQFALGGGLEQDKHPARIGSYIWMGKGKVSGLGVFEDGGSGFGYNVENNYQAASKFGLGTLCESYKGCGPKVEVLVPGTRLKLWSAPLWKNGPFGALFGIRWSL